MPSLRRSLLRRYRFLAPQLLRRGLLLLTVLLLCDGIAALYFSQIQAALSLSTPVHSQSASVATPVSNQNVGVIAPTVAPMVSQGQTVLAKDTFQRADQTYWGTSSDGQVWQAEARTARNFAIFHNMGIVKGTTNFACGILGAAVPNSELSFSASLSHYGPSSLGAVLRWNDPGDFYQVVLDGQNLTLSRVMDGMDIPLRMIPFPARDGASYTFRFRAVGSQLSAMIWPTDQPAPADWQISLSDSALSAGHAGIGALVQNGAQAQITAFMEVEL